MCTTWSTKEAKCEEVTTDTVHDFFLPEGVDPSPSSVQKFRKESGFVLVHPSAFKREELDEEVLERGIRKVCVVASEGKTHQRETVILPSFGTGQPLPLIFIFHGVKQLKVKVLPGFPVLVVFTRTAIMNTELLKFIFQRVLTCQPRESPYLAGYARVTFLR